MLSLQRLDHVGLIDAEVATAHNHHVEIELLLGPADQPLLDRVLRDQPVHVHWLRLADAVGAILHHHWRHRPAALSHLRLQIDLGIEVGVVVNDSVGSVQVDAKTSGALQIIASGDR